MKFYTLDTFLNDILTTDRQIVRQNGYVSHYLSMKETDNSYLYTYALTGTEKEDISVEVTNEWIKITYTNEDKTKSISDYVGIYQFNKENARCKYRNGLLTITLPKTLEHQSKKLVIESA
jgi:HSP20 family molecular chaperone IbpA